jgi:hypothetical protein
MPCLKNKAPQWEHGTLQRTPPLPPKDDDTLKRRWVVWRTELKLTSKGGPRTKEVRASNVLKDKGEEWKNKRRMK